MAETCARIIAALFLPVLAAITIAGDAPLLVKLAMWAGWLVMAVAIDAAAPRVQVIPRGENPITRVLPLMALLLQAAVLLYALWTVTIVAPTPGQFAVIALALGISAGTVGISAAHELVHRRNRWFQFVARAFMLLVSYPHFPLVHLRVHHRYVGTALDPGTSRLNEALPHFIARAYLLSWRSGWHVECTRLRRRCLGAWHLENAVLRAIVSQAVVYLLVAWIFEPIALALFVAHGIVAMLLTLAVDYTQHYGVVRREMTPGRFAPLHPTHAWTTDHASNRSTFNLGLHAAHHLHPRTTHTGLDREPGSLEAPYGYPGLVLLALVPPLWFNVMNRRFPASEQLP